MSHSSSTPSSAYPDFFDPYILKSIAYRCRNYNAWEVKARLSESHPGNGYIVVAQGLHTGYLLFRDDGLSYADACTLAGKVNELLNSLTSDIS